MLKTRTHSMGVFLVLLAASLNGLLPLIVTSVNREGGHFTNMLFYTGILVAPLSALICRFAGQPLAATKKQHIACILLSVLQYVTSLLLYSAYNYISTGLTTTIHFIYPVAVLFMTLVVFRERCTFREVISIILSVIGVAVLSYSAGERIDMTGVLLAFLSGVCYAGYIVVLGKSSAAQLSPFVFSFYNYFYNAIFAGSTSIAAGTLTGLTSRGWLIVLFAAVSACTVACSLQAGIKRVGEKSAAVLSVAEPLVSVVVGIVLLNEAFSLRSFMGISFIIAAAILASLLRKKER